MRNPFRRRRTGARRARVARGTWFPVHESRDLREDQLDRISGGIPDFPRNEGGADYVIRLELPVLATRPSDNPDLWF